MQNLDAKGIREHNGDGVHGESYRGLMAKPGVKERLSLLPPAVKYLRRFYERLPMIREIRQIRDAVFAMQADLNRVVSKELIELLQFSIFHEPRYADSKRLVRFAHQTYSQNGEDGMIAEVCRRIGTSSRTFLEIGVGDGRENNTVALLMKGWQGWWIDADHAAMASIASMLRSQIASQQLIVLNAAVTMENIHSLLSNLGVPDEIDVLSLDIDLNTYWVWKAMSRIKARLAVVEYNASFPPDVDWKIEYKPDRSWNKTSYFGASLKALEVLGRQMGYSLVGCDFTGVNAFFVRSDLCGNEFAEPFTAENHYEPPRYGLISHQGHPSGFRPY